MNHLKIISYVVLTNQVTACIYSMNDSYNALKSINLTNFVNVFMWFPVSCSALELVVV